ncbi:MAG: hypothetical protein KDC85_18435 [Saprospiraceae bacterium]|nr:hypothetical protein [Saprospiraceae bacterium]MCB9322851.1 hypothetical protein [Lewinellaceae bacterium]
MKKPFQIYFVLVCFLLAPLFGVAQKFYTQNELKEVVGKRTIYLSSKPRGKSRAFVKVDLPENTRQWVYVFTTAETEKEANIAINLLNQLTSLIPDPAYRISAKVLQQIVLPQGANVVDIFATDQKGYESFFELDMLGTYANAVPSVYLEEGSVANTVKGRVLINDLTKSTQYLCFKNSSLLKGIWLTIEVVAEVENNVYVDEWHENTRQDIYNSCKGYLSGFGEKANDLCFCATDDFTAVFKPSEYKEMNAGALESNLKKSLDRCYTVQRSPGATGKEGDLMDLMAEANASVLTHDYQKALEKYIQIEALGYQEAEIYYSIGRNALLTGNYELARKNTGTALAMDPGNLRYLGCLAHCFLLMDEYESAEAIYLEHKKEKLDNGVRWKEMVEQDFGLFDSIGFPRNTENMNKIREKLKIRGN